MKKLLSILFICSFILGMTACAKDTTGNLAVSMKSQEVENMPLSEASKPSDVTNITIGDCEQPSVILRIDCYVDTGFMGTVLELETVWELPDAPPLELGSQLKIILREDSVFQQFTSDTSSILTDGVPSKEQLPEGSIVMVQYDSFKPDTGTVYVNWITSDLSQWRDEP